MRLLTLLLLAFFLISTGFDRAHAEGLGGIDAEIASQTVGKLDVDVAIKIDQITFVDQQAENFGAVGTLVLRYTDPTLGFDAVERGYSLRSFNVEDFRTYAHERKALVPIFLIRNQQGRRFVQQSQLVISDKGEVTFVERFSATFQAPYFNFKKYPFDSQKFFVEVSSVFPLEYVEYHPLEDLSGLGDLLGEEEWIMHSPRIAATMVEGLTGLETSQVQLSFEAKRHVQYYLLRFMLPLIIILFVSWATFFLEEYRRRIDMANANLLVFVAFNFAISTTLPKLGYLTFMDMLLVGMFIITGSMVLVNIALRRLKLMDREVLARKIDMYLIVWVYPLMYLGFLFWAVRFYLI